MEFIPPEPGAPDNPEPPAQPPADLGTPPEAQPPTELGGLPGQGDAEADVRPDIVAPAERGAMDVDQPQAGGEDGSSIPLREQLSLRERLEQLGQEVVGHLADAGAKWGGEPTGYERVQADIGTIEDYANRHKDT
jgi:hypothetical protein